MRVLILVLLELPPLSGGRGSHCSGRTSNTGMGGGALTSSCVASVVLIVVAAQVMWGWGRGLSH